MFTPGEERRLRTLLNSDAGNGEGGAQGGGSREVFLADGAFDELVDQAQQSAKEGKLGDLLEALRQVVKEGCLEAIAEVRQQDEEGGGSPQGGSPKEKKAPPEKSEGQRKGRFIHI